MEMLETSTEHCGTGLRGRANCQARQERPLHCQWVVVDEGSQTTLPQQQQNEDHTQLFAQLIARTAKDIEVLIESLPNEESSVELQSASLQKLEEENLEAANKLEDVVKQGEATLKEIQAALHDIAQAQIEMQKFEGSAMQ